MVNGISIQKEEEEEGEENCAIAYINLKNLRLFSF